LVGKDHAKLTIQSGLARHVSKPLDHLMNNGQTRESKHRIAVLEDEEVEVFAAFTQYAYTGEYTVPQQSPQSQPPQQQQQKEPKEQKEQKDEPEAPPPSLRHLALRTHSVASFLPPPAPTPPPAERGDLRRLPRHEQLGLDWEDPFEEAVDTQNEQVTPEETSLLDEQVERPVFGPKPAEAEEEEESFNQPSRKPSKKDKKKKKKGAAAAAAAAPTAVEEAAPVANLTPPNTPPFESRDIEENPTRPRLQVEQEHDPDNDCAIETDPGEDFQDGPSGAAGDWWDRPLSPGAVDGRAGDRGDRDVRRLQHSANAPMIDTSFATQRISAPRRKGISSWGEFSSLEYFHQTPSPPAVAEPEVEVPYILFHAKVYVFATRYLISGLAQLCLKKLHRQLVDYALIPPSENDLGDLDETEANQFDAHARMFLEVLRYTYHKTNRFEPESQTSATLLRESELRKLVAQYAACKMRELAFYVPASIRVPSSPTHGPGSGVSVIAGPGGGLRELLDSIPELASDLVFRMM
jgi:hypothetical protein